MAVRNDEAFGSICAEDCESWPWLLQQDDTALFGMQISYQIAAMNTEFLTKPKDSAECHQTLSSWGRGGWGLGTRLVITYLNGQTASFPLSSFTCYFSHNCRESSAPLFEGV